MSAFVFRQFLYESLFMDMQNLPKPLREHGFEADFAYGPPNAFYAAGEMPQVGRLYVDRFGREREDSFIMEGLKRELMSIDIWDVVAGKYYGLVPADKKILLEDPIDPREGRGGLAIRLPGVVIFSLSRHSLSEGKIIGTKQIEVLTCKGSVIEGSGAGEHPGFVIECWYAEKIAYIVTVNAMWKLSDGRKAENTFRLSKIELREPDPELFKVPADYKPVKLVPVKN